LYSKYVAGITLFSNRNYCAGLWSLQITACGNYEQNYSGNLDVFNLIAESYLLALCKSGRILDVLKNIDMEKHTSAKSMSNIFQFLGRLLLESDAENLLLDLTVRGMFVILFSYLSYSVDGYRGGKLLCF
jgi:hypothetical protein